MFGTIGGAIGLVIVGVVVTFFAGYEKKSKITCFKDMPRAKNIPMPKVEKPKHDPNVIKEYKKMEMQMEEHMEKTYRRPCR